MPKKKDTRQLFVESAEIVSQINLSNELKEAVQMSSGKTGTLIVKNLPATILNRENQNGRIYSTEVVQKAIDNAKIPLETKQLLGKPNEHPDGSFIAPSEASHVITKMYIKPNVRYIIEGKEEVNDMLFMDWEVLNTSNGRDLRALFEAECSIGLSIRGLGDLEGRYVKNYEILGIDCVGNPSSGTFTRMPVSESVQVELADPRKLQETFTVTTSSTNVVRDLNAAAQLQAELDNIGYGTVVKTSTKLDSETDPKTGAETTITTLEAETSDDVGELDQALQLARNAMLNGKVNIDSITIENIKEEEPQESVEGEDKPLNEDNTKASDNQQILHIANNAGKLSIDQLKKFNKLCRGFEKGTVTEEDMKAFAQSCGISPLDDDEERYGKCGWCGDNFPLSDLRREKDFGYVCNHCAKGLESREGKLNWDEEYIPESQMQEANGPKFYIPTDINFSPEQLKELVNIHDLYNEGKLSNSQAFEAFEKIGIKNPAAGEMITAWDKEVFDEIDELGGLFENKMDENGYGTNDSSNKILDYTTSEKLSSYISGMNSNIPDFMKNNQKEIENPTEKDMWDIANKLKKDWNLKEQRPEWLKSFYSLINANVPWKIVESILPYTLNDIKSKRAAHTNNDYKYYEDVAKLRDNQENKNESAMAESTKKQEADPYEGKKFVLRCKTNGKYIAMNGNAIDFVENPKDAIHFTKGKEESGIIHLSSVEKILDAMGQYEVEKYYRKDPKPAQEALGSGNPVAGNIQPQDTTIPQSNTNNEILHNDENTSLNEEDSGYKAKIEIQRADGNMETNEIPVASKDPSSMLNEISNLYNMKAQNAEGMVKVTVINSMTGEALVYNPETKNFEPSTEIKEDIQTFDNDKNKDVIEQNDSTLTVKVDDQKEIEKEFDSPLQASIAKAAMEKGDLEGDTMLDEKQGPKAGWYVSCDGVGVSGPYESKEEALSGLEGWENVVDVQYVSEQDLNEVLYRDPSEPSDPFVDQSLNEEEGEAEVNSDPEEDINVMLGDIDWDFDSISDNFMANSQPDDVATTGDLESLLNDLPETLSLTIKAKDINMDEPEKIKDALLTLAGNSTGLKINNATILDIK